MKENFILETNMQKSGFIALITSLILSLALVLVSVTASSLSFSGRMSALGREWKKESFYAAKSCLNLALLRVSENPLYKPSADFVQIEGEVSCTIVSISVDTPSVGHLSISTTGTASKSYTHILAVENESNKSVSFEEVP